MWTLSHRADPPAVALADRHYSRQQPGTPQFMPPGGAIVLLYDDGKAVWGSSWPRYAQHAWRGAWVCSIFRNESTTLSSTLIMSAIAATRWFWPVPAAGCITFVDAAVTAARRSQRALPGECFRRAGFVDAGRTQSDLWVLRLWPADMPAAMPPRGAQMPLFAE